MGKDKDKKHINILVIGHVDSGNSDTTGHLIDKLGVLDGKFETSKYYCTIIDVPEQADCVVLIIDSTTGVSILSKNEPIEHTLRAFALGRQQLICCCNETQAAAFSKDHYDEIVREASSYLKSLGYNEDKISFVPISGSKGNNMIEISTTVEWYNGPTLRETIDQIKGPKRPVREESSHKNQLQAFSLKKYQKYPVYITRSEGELHDCKFWCTIEVNGQHFKSVHLHSHKKEAEQDAAKVAYEFLMARDGDNLADVLALIDKDLLLYKTILYEFTSKKKTAQPSYSCHRQQGPGRMTFFAATVSVDGKEYTGEISKGKNAAAEKAARLAVTSILDTNDECMLKVFRSKRRFVTATPSSNQPSKKHKTKTSVFNLIPAFPDPEEAPPSIVASS